MTDFLALWVPPLGFLTLALVAAFAQKRFYEEVASRSGPLTHDQQLARDIGDKPTAVNMRPTSVAALRDSTPRTSAWIA